MRRAMRFLHCSDVHVTADYTKVPLRELGLRRVPSLAELYLRGRARHHARSPEVIRQIVRDVERHQVDHLIVSGDLTGYALEQEFDGARAALEPLALDKRRCTVIPGNHDTYTPGAVQKRRF